MVLPDQWLALIVQSINTLVGCLTSVDRVKTDVSADTSVDMDMWFEFPLIYQLTNEWETIKRP